MTLGRHLGAKSPNEKQAMLLREMAGGLASAIDYYQGMYGMTRYQAIEVFRSVQRDRVMFPIKDAQPPGALLDEAGPFAAIGEGSATKNGDAFSDDPAGSVEGASVIAAVRAATGEVTND
jgi:hypothetical protein